MTVKMLAKIFNYISFEMYCPEHISILHALSGKRNLAKNTQLFSGKANFLAANLSHFQTKLHDQMMIEVGRSWSW